MKAKLHLPAGNYAYIELEVEGTPQEIVDKYFEVETIYQTGRKLKADNEDF